MAAVSLDHLEHIKRILDILDCVEYDKNLGDGIKDRNLLPAATTMRAEEIQSIHSALRRQTRFHTHTVDEARGNNLVEAPRNDIVFKRDPGHERSPFSVS
jgi:hypothetical protein